jgi:hypothetical protein|tara:strand:+ start:1059 stop:1433 length:375 start_codon:yes stop_codon:yes gene_type:complete
MALPVQRTYTFAAAPVLNVPQFLTDQQTGQNNFLILTPNVLQDLVMNPDNPDATAVYRFQLVKNGNTTPVRADSPSMSPTTQGRVPIGNVSLSPGNYQWEATQTATGAGLLAVTILARYASPLN